MDDPENDDETDERSSTNSTPVEREPKVQNEVELVFKPLPHGNDYYDASLTQTRYIKTTTNATVEHLVKYLSMRHKLDCPENGKDQDVKENNEESLFTLYLANGPGQFIPLASSMTLDQIADRKTGNNPLELHYAYKLKVEKTNEGWEPPEGMM